MDSSFFLGIVVGLLLAYIFVRFSRAASEKGRDRNDRPEYIDLKKKWYFDDKTKAYIAIMAIILVLLFIAYTMNDDNPVRYLHK